MFSSDTLYLKIRDPKRGDVIVFKFPGSEGAPVKKKITVRLPFSHVKLFEHETKSEVDYIKRVVGVAGDKIEIKEGVLHINDQPIKCDDLGDIDIPKES